ncbi:carboxypeptidase-like regulatory domain-containing protein [Hymenobacter sp. PAMC 26628]|uniref:carboxypeptidase-like regulatory domain-containing protein n=1 Tax=Hymenobacter sp. PAMC 26628 TaxID=1484118 RepID=UPI0007705AFF|nr:carboxypeptidase-like regulatory domain-containing protein [Hymenobacter sp. PAMC 26628]AMJ67548.1 hypothetical protein AXW84_20610 [Hymenobacter sp. PAMC 26628]
MAARLTSVHIPTPCAESWAAMTPRGPGRHCAACQNTVVDFTQKTDAEILAVLQQAAGRSCGRFAAEQLGRPLQPLAVGAPSRWRAWLAAAAAVWGLREGVGAPAVAQVPTELRPLGAPAAAQVAGSQLSKQVLVQGRITDGSTHEGLPGATVSVQGTNTWCSTKADGTFQLTVPESYARPDRLTATVSFVGYETQQITIAAKAGAPTLEMALALSTVWLGEVSPVSLRKPWPWHPRRFYYWLAQPFRRG